jgi:hypothetical protein
MQRHIFLCMFVFSPFSHALNAEDRTFILLDIELRVMLCNTTCSRKTRLLVDNQFTLQSCEKQYCNGIDVTYFLGTSP